MSTFKEDIIKTHVQTDGFQKVQADILATQKRLNGYSEEIKDLKYQKTLLIAAGKKESAEYKNINARIKELTGNVAVEKAALDKLYGSLNMTHMSYNQLKKRADELKRALNNLSQHVEPERWNRLNNELQQVQRQMEKVRVGMRSASAEVRNAPSMWQNAIGKVKNFLPALGISSAIISGFNKLEQLIRESLPAFREYDDKLADVMKTTGLAKNEVEALSKSLKKINTRTPQNELLDLARVAGKLGIESAQEVEGFVRAADKINVALSEDLGGNAEEAINQVGKLVDIFNIKQEFGIEDAMIRVGSAVNELGAASTANEGYIVDFTKRLAGVAPQAKISIQNVMGYGATLDQFGQQCETSGTAMSQAITGMFKKTDVYARIAGMRVKDFTALMNKDANAAFITFLKGLKGNNDGMAAMVKNLNDLKMDGSRTTQILGALASNVETLEQQQLLANQAFADGTSIINEFNIKNNTAQAKYEKFKNLLQDIRVEIGGHLVPVVQKLHDTIVKVAADSLESLKDESRHYRTTSSEIEAKQKRVDDLATTYYKLKAETKSNTEKQNLLNDTIKQLAELCPEAVSGYNKYGEAIDINIRKLNVAIERQRKLNELMGKNVASKSFKNIKEEWNKLQINNDKRQEEKASITKYRDMRDNGSVRQKLEAEHKLPKAQSSFDRASDNINEARTNLRENINLLRDQGNTYQEIADATKVSVADLMNVNSAKVMDDIRTLRSIGKGYADIAKEIGGPVEAVIKIAASYDKNYDRPFGETDDKPKLPPDIPDNNTKEKGKWSIEKDAQFMKEKLALRAKLQSGELSSEQEYNDQLLTLEIASLERRIALNKEKGTDLQALQDDLADKRYKQKKSEEDRLNKLIAASLEGGRNPNLQQDLDRENASYRKRLEDLGLFWKDRKDMTKDELAALENLERRHNENLRYIYIGETQRRFDANRQMAESSINELKTAHNNQLAAAETFEQKKALVAQLYGDERAKRVRTENEALKLIRKKYTAEEDELARKELENLISIYQEMMTELEKVLANADVSGMTDADREVLQQKIDDLKKQIAALKGEKPTGDDKKYGDDLDILGFSKKDWDNFFTNIKDGISGFEEWGQAIGMIGGAMANAFSTVSNLMTAIEERQFKTYEKTANKKKKTLEQQKNAGVITEATYNSKVQAIDEETERKREEMERKQAIRNKAMSVFQSLIATAVAVTQALPDVPLSIIVGALGAIQTAAILATPLPGAEQGGMINVEREQDGRRFYAEFSPNRRGYVNRPTVIVGENGPEYVIPNEMLQNPEVAGFVNAIEASRLKGEFRNPLNMPVPGRALGGYVMTPTNTVAASSAGGVTASSTVSIPPELIATLDRLNKRLDKPLPAYLRKYGSGGLYDEMNRDSKIRKTL